MHHVHTRRWQPPHSWWRQRWAVTYARGGKASFSSWSPRSPASPIKVHTTAPAPACRALGLWYTGS
jgi:hypothetical protein